MKGNGEKNAASSFQTSPSELIKFAHGTVFKAKTGYSPLITFIFLGHAYTPGVRWNPTIYFASSKRQHVDVYFRDFNRAVPRPGHLGPVCKCLARLYQ